MLVLQDLHATRHTCTTRGHTFLLLQPLTSNDEPRVVVKATHDQRCQRALHACLVTSPWDLLGFARAHLDSLGIIWVHFDSVAFTWIHLASLVLTWAHLVRTQGGLRIHLGREAWELHLTNSAQLRPQRAS